MRTPHDGFDLSRHNATLYAKIAAADTVAKVEHCYGALIADLCACHTIPATAVVTLADTIIALAPARDEWRRHWLGQQFGDDNMKTLTLPQYVTLSTTLTSCHVMLSAYGAMLHSRHERSDFEDIMDALKMLSRIAKAAGSATILGETTGPITFTMPADLDEVGDLFTRVEEIAKRLGADHPTAAGELSATINVARTSLALH